MESTLFHDLFQTFTTAELRQLKKFVASPYFNGRQQLSPLLDFLTEARLRSETPDAKSAFAAAFPAKPFDDQKWRLTLSQLFKLTEEFLALQEVYASPVLEKTHLAQAYRKRSLPKHFQRTLEALRRAQEQQAQRPADFFEDQFRIEWESYRHLSAGKRTEAFNLQEVSDVLDKTFIARKLRHACLSLSHQAVFKTEYEFGLLPQILTWVEMHPALLDEPAITLYFHCYLTLTEAAAPAQSPITNHQSPHFQRFQKLLFDFGERLPEEERRNLFLLAINFGIRQINASRKEYDRPVLDLYKSALAAGLLLENGVLSRFAFNNIAAIALRLGEVDWVENFIRENKNRLEREHRSVTASLNLARLEFAKKNYREALLHLQCSDYKDMINNLIAKTLQLKIYFETDEHEVLEAHLRNMKNYLRRQRSIGYHKENYLNIIRFTQALVEMNPLDRKERSSLRSEIGTVERLTEREWLLEMLGE